jgi:dTDP-6-deoxy-L-talose 4-dehydrogenase (NAD+)
MKVLITGGNGFLGSNIARECLEVGYDVMIISRNSNNINDIIDKVTFVKYTSFSLHKSEICKFLPNIVIHTAWDGGNAYADVNSTSQFTNISFGIELLNVLCEMNTNPTFIGFGSFAEYGIISKHAVETDKECPVTMYGLSKYTFKQISEFICKQNNVKWAWIRPCYIYGYGDVPTRLIPSTIAKLLAGDDCVLDECDVTIDYLHIKDFRSAIMNIITRNQTGIFNVCSSNEYSLRHVINTIKENIFSTSNIIFDKSKNRQGLSTYVCGSNDKLKAIDWTPIVSIKDGIIDIIEKTRSKYEIYDLNEIDGIHAEY